jgi:20S proteasome subunit beta 2
MASELTLSSDLLVDFENHPAGFNFDNLHRNRQLAQNATDKNDTTAANTSNGYLPEATKTGTTICGTLFNGGVVLGADTRATNGELVAEKNCKKIHYMAPNIYCCGAGTAADTDNTSKLIQSQLELLRMETKGQSRVVTALTQLKHMLFRYQGHISAAMIMGGCDVNGPQLYQCYPHGSTSKVSFTSMGSGCLAAMAMLESGWKDQMNEEEAVELVKRAIRAGIFHDSGSGSRIDICIIRADGQVDYRRNTEKPCEVDVLRNAVQRSGRMTMRPGLTPVLQTEFTPHPLTLADVTVATEMEVES